MTFVTHSRLDSPRPCRHDIIEMCTLRKHSVLETLAPSTLGAEVKTNDRYRRYWIDRLYPAR